MRRSTIVGRKFLTYFVTTLILGASFGVVYGLTHLQLKSGSQVLSIAISLSITLINLVIKGTQDVTQWWYEN